ncbi:hypothetical protein ABPG74_010688 [Tetrahymena malaccensis]
MDFSQLAQITHKNIQDWGKEEIEKWCEFINLPQYKQAFGEHVATSKELLKLDQQKIENILGIKQALHIKKILKWVEKIFYSYQSYYESKIESKVSYMVLYPQQTLNKKYLRVAYELCESNLKIGSAKSCHVHLDGKDINQRHAEIKFREGKYLLQDLGSLYGTYVKIREIELLKGTIFMIGSQIIEVEDLSSERTFSMADQLNKKQEYVADLLENQRQKETKELQILNEQEDSHSIISQNDQTINNHINSFQFDDQLFMSFKKYNYLSFDQTQSHFNLQFDSTKINSYTIGRKKNNSLPFTNDLEMSGNHAVIVYENNKIYLRDRESKNGIWLRLSSTEKKSDFLILQNGMSIRFGYYNDYKTFFGNIKEENCQRGFSFNRVDKYCLRCFKKYHNTMLIPCSHQVYCKDCIKLHCENLQKVCPECKNDYWDYVEIFQ